MTEQSTTDESGDVEEHPVGQRPTVAWAVAGVLVVLVLGAATRFLESQVPQWAAGTPFVKVAKAEIATVNDLRT